MSDNKQQIIDSLAKFSWHSFMGNKSLGTPLTITYSFLTGRPDYYSGFYGDNWLKNSRSVTDVNSFTAMPIGYSALRP